MLIIEERRIKKKVDRTYTVAVLGLFQFFPDTLPRLECASSIGVGSSILVGVETCYHQQLTDFVMIIILR